MLSTKVLADVVEALIGAAFLDGGIEKAVLCASRLVPDIPAIAPDRIIRGSIYGSIGPKLGRITSHHFVDLERLLGYEFKESGLLVEAVTHPSCESDTHTSSY
jgi:dsRNA-specific ribonuclease